MFPSGSDNMRLCATLTVLGQEQLIGNDSCLCLAVTVKGLVLKLDDQTMTSYIITLIVHTRKSHNIEQVMGFNVVTCIFLSKW